MRRSYRPVRIPELGAKVWTDNRLLAVGRILGLKVTRKTRVIHSPCYRFYRAYIMSDGAIHFSPSLFVKEMETEDIELNRVVGFPGIEKMGYGPKSDTLVYVTSNGN